jgi:hypothetical protein
MGLERGPLSLVSTTEELLDRKVAAPVLENRENTAGGMRHADQVAPSIRTSWQSLRRQAAVARSVSTKLWNMTTERLLLADTSTGKISTICS